MDRAGRRLRWRRRERRPAGPSELARAEGSLQAELEAAVDHLGLAAEPGERVAPVRCDDSTRKDVTSGYRIRLRWPAATSRRCCAAPPASGASAAAASASSGRSGTFPAVFATADPGWTFALQLFPERGEALLSGGTPCLPDPEA